jgi:DNA-binding transcriptional regulator YiaG
MPSVKRSQISPTKLGQLSTPPNMSQRDSECMLTEMTRIDGTDFARIRKESALTIQSFDPVKSTNRSVLLSCEG